MGCGCKKARPAQGQVSGPTGGTPQTVDQFEVRRPGEESQFFPTRPQANTYAMNKPGATIHRVRSFQDSAA